MNIKKQKTILLVEDEVIIAMNEKNTLEKYGYNIITAITGEEAVEIVKNNTGIDLILMDINLGKGMDGTQAAEIILKDYEIPVVFLSSHIEREIVEKTEKISSYGYVVKNSGDTVLDASIKMAFRLFSANIKLEVNKLKQETMISNISDVIGIIGINGRVKYISPSIEKWFGWQANSISSAKSWTKIHPDDVARIQEEFINLLKVDQSVKKVEFRFRCKDGTYKPVSLSATNFSNNPNIGGVLINYHDISERIAAEKEIMQKNNKLSLLSSRQEALLSAIPDIIMEVNNEKVYTWANKTGVEFFGEDVVGKKADYYFAGEQDTYQIVQPLFDGNEQIVYLESLQKRRDGEIRLLAWWCKTLKDENGNVIGSISSARDITKRKRSEEALRESEARFRSIVENSTAGYFFIDREGRYQVVNEAWLRLHKFDSPEEIRGRHFFFTQVDSDRLRANEIVKNHLAGNGITHGEFTRRCKDGSTGWHTYSINPVRQNGDIIGLEGFIIDITERKHSEEDLRESENKWRTLFDILPVGVSIIDSDLNIIDFNRRLGDILGFTKEDLKDEKIKKRKYLRFDKTLMDPEEIPSSIAIKEQRVVRNVEIGVVKEDGDIVWTNVSAAPLSFPEAACVIVTTDITERKLVEEDLRESEERFRKIFEEDQLGIVILNKEFKFEKVNQAFCKITGYSQEELILMTFKEITHPDHMIQDVENVMKLTHGEIPYYKTEKRYICKNKEIVWGNVIVSIIRDKDDKFLYYLTTVENITERRKADEKVKALLQEKELLLKEVHHRIKNNMNTIKGLIALQTGTLKDPSSIAALKDAESRVQSMMVLYDKLNQSAGFNYMPVMNYLPSLVEEIIANFPGSKFVEIEKKIDDIVLSVKILQPLGLIINELLTNIMKYAFIGRNDGLIKVSAKLKGETVSIEIQDNGIGMPESVDFNNFPDEQHTHQGFGLRLVAMLTEQIDGTIRIERGNGSSARKGTKIILEFKK